MSEAQAMVDELDVQAEEVEAEKKPATLEDIARAHGWKPEEEWKGDPPESGFKTAEEYVTDGFKIQGRQHDKIERLQSTVERVESNLTEMAKGEAKRMRIALEKQKARLTEEREEAYEEMDREKVDKIEKEITQTNEQIKEIETQAEAPAATEEAAAKAEADFMVRNKWFGDDMVMTNATKSMAETINQFSPGLPPEEFYQKLESAMKEEYPDKFRNTNRDRPSSVSGDAPRGKAGEKKTFNQLPAEAKEAFEEISFHTKMTKEDYAKAYYEQE